MRYKKYDEAFILEGAYRLVKERGFSSLTAREIAKELAISTQPIYIEFKNMRALRNALIKHIYKETRINYFFLNDTIDQFIENIFLFSQKEDELYHSVTIEKELHRSFSNYLFDIFNENEEAIRRFQTNEERFFVFILICSVANASQYMSEWDDEKKTMYLETMKQLIHSQLGSE